MVSHETPIEAVERDMQSLRELQSLLGHPETIASMDDASVNAMIDRWLLPLRRTRIGGRSWALVALTVVLWRVRDRRESVRFNVEENLAFAFRMSVDPSLLFPEWAVVLAGVLIARYVDRMPKDAQEEVLTQCRLLLQHLERNHSLQIAVRNAAMTLLDAWDMGFPEGMNPVVKACLRAWPDTETIAAMPAQRLDELVDHLNAMLPARFSQRELRIYRLGLERRGLWSLLENASLA